MFEHHVTVAMTEEGRQTLAMFLARLPARWQADVPELFQGDPTGQLMIQYVRTPAHVDLFVAGALTRDLPGIVEHAFHENRPIDERPVTEGGEEVDR